VTTASALSGEQVKQIAGIFSLPIGGLEGKNPNFFFLDNPVWQKPLVRLSDDEFYCPVPQQFFHNIHRVFEALLENPVHVQALEKRRSEFLEDYVAELFQVAFSRSDSRRNIKWKDGADVYETDLLVRVDSFLFIVEAKAGAITSPALRGAPLRLRRHIQDLLVAPSVQSQRLADKLKSIAPAELDRSLFLEPLGDFLENMNTVVRISVTLEDFAACSHKAMISRPLAGCPRI